MVFPIVFYTVNPQKKIRLRPNQVSRLFELLAIISTLDKFSLSQNTHYLNCPLIISNARQFPLSQNIHYLNCPTIISNVQYYYLKPLSQIAYYLKLLFQTLIISTARSLSQTLDIFPLSQNTHYLNCPFIISNARQFSIISKYSLSQLPSPQKPIISDNLETCGPLTPVYFEA